jgi:hypothetical protein
MITVDEMARKIEPRKTILFLGAGSSIPSGAPSGPDLARYLEKNMAGGETISTDLTELCSILENKYGRKALIEAVRQRLSSLSPSGGILVIPEYNWRMIYTTNFDALIEMAYSRFKKPIIPIRSNFDYGKAEGSDGVPLLKIHGCIKSDIVDGYNSRIVLTERDYDNYQEYRETLYKRLSFDLTSKDFLFIGYSLKDAHIRQETKKAASLHKKAGTPGRLFALIYTKDEDRAQLIEDYGFQVAFGGIDELMQSFCTIRPVVCLTPTLRHQAYLAYERSSTSD